MEWINLQAMQNWVQGVKNEKKNSSQPVLRFILFFSLFITNYLPAVCQQESGQIKGLEPKDSTQINQLLTDAGLLRERAPDSAIAIYSRTLSYCNFISYRLGMAKSLLGLSRSYANKNDQNNAIELARRTLLYCDASPAAREVAASAYFIFSEVYYYKGRYDSCAWYRYEALNEIENGHVTNPIVKMRIYGSILQFWLNVQENISNDPYVAEMMGRINELEKNGLVTNDSAVLSQVYFYKAGYFNNIRQNDSARAYCLKTIALSQFKKSSAPSVIMATLINMANTYLEDKRPAEAIKCINEAVAVIPAADRPTNRLAQLSNFFLGEAYVQQHAYQKAIDVTAPALAEMQHQHITRLTENAHSVLADAYEGLGNFKQASYHRKQYSVIRDSLTKVAQMDAMYNVEMKYRIADRDKKLAQSQLLVALNANRLKTKNSWIAGITGLFIVVTLAGLLLYRSKSHKERLQSEKLRNLQQEMEINRLNAMLSGEEKERSRIARDLHDGLGGTMGAIRTRLSSIFRRHKTADVDAEFTEVMQLLEEASQDLRKTAHNLMPEVLLQEGLVKATALFCSRVSKGRNIDIDFETWGEPVKMEAGFELAVYRILQELIHNIIKHAEASHAIVQLTFHTTQLCITVEDNGKGMATDILAKAEGMGLRAIKERMQPLNGQLNIESSPGSGTSIYLEFMIESKKNSGVPA